MDMESKAAGVRERQGGAEMGSGDAQKNANTARRDVGAGAKCGRARCEAV